MAVVSLMRWEKSIVGAGLLGICGLAWLYLARMADQMAYHAAMGMAYPLSNSWNAGNLLMTFLMWAVMMVAMMVPSAAPMILTFAAIHRQRTGSGKLSAPPWIFLSGYLALWTLFSAAATLAQWGLHSAALFSPVKMTVGPAIGGGLFVLAGLYQWTPLKNRCLSHCASPLDFLLTSWREGRWGAFVMGLHHGTYCVGCCAFLMMLLFVGGVMNLLWVAALGSLVLIEKLVNSSRIVPQVFGVVFVLTGIAMFVSSL